jgi:hypothetical protein
MPTQFERIPRAELRPSCPMPRRTSDTTRRSAPAVSPNDRLQHWLCPASAASGDRRGCASHPQGSRAHKPASASACAKLLFRWRRRRHRCRIIAPQPKAKRPMRSRRLGAVSPRETQRRFGATMPRSLPYTYPAGIPSTNIPTGMMGGSHAVRSQAPSNPRASGCFRGLIVMTKGVDHANPQCQRREPQSRRNIVVHPEQDELVAEYAGGGDDRQKSQSRPMVAQFAENGTWVLEQPTEHQDAEERKCDQVVREQYCADFAVAEPHGGDGDDAGRHDECKTASGKVEHQRR